MEQEMLAAKWLFVGEVGGRPTRPLGALFLPATAPRGLHRRPGW